MLDATTKRRIDTARDILVGKVPDPKSQVEQITIALIYKFMDDIDAGTEEDGGERSFFTGDFAGFGWSKLMDRRLGGHDTLNLYIESITKMSQNPGVPPLFRDIFNNAYLPYRDPETLRSFLRIIDEFSYEDSESLGDAFEYLLSVLDSQGDAGQFRTPRHIIDFIVAVVDPKKNESVLDPACGTAGFLISSYKHIMAANTGDDGQSRLTPQERGALAENFRGYDISPDMVRLSLVNMYLHGFVAPHIYEYDTLTSEDRWNEYADVILANPPFMSPKGGIRPHNRFSVQSKRSEVLFVDYMAEHLSPTGRAGIIVPEGIIFQSQNAHKRLRKMLVEEYLVAVVSLPAGVFQPYSGVKTSVLILDRALAKRADHIAFFKVENDGFDLGAQRRPIGGSDLPGVQADTAEYIRRLGAGESVDDFGSTFGLVVEKDRIATDGEYSLSGERYVPSMLPSTDYPWPKIGTLVTTITAPIKLQKTTFGKSGRFPIIDQSQTEIAGWTDDESALIYPTNPLVIFGDHTCTVKLMGTPFAQGADGIKILQSAENLDPRFLFYVLRTRPLESSGYQRHFSKLKEIQIPLPPLSVQQEIVAEIEGYQRVIDGARAVVENYRPHIVVDPQWPVVALGAIADVTSSKRILAEEYVPVGIPFYRTKEIVELSSGRDISSEYFISSDRFSAIRASFGAPHRGDILVSAVGTIGTSWVVSDDRDFYFKDGNLLWVKNFLGADPNYIKYCMDSVFTQGVDNIAFGAAYKALTILRLKEFKIPLPPLETQQAIAAEVQAEQALVEANRQLIERFEQKIQAAVGRVWGSGGVNGAVGKSRTA